MADSHLVSSRLTCRVCGDVIGVYEPLLVCGQAQTRTTSLAREPELHDTNDMFASWFRARRT